MIPFDAEKSFNDIFRLLDMVYNKLDSLCTHLNLFMLNYLYEKGLYNVLLATCVRNDLIREFFDVLFFYTTANSK